MKGDFSRYTFDPARHYSGVLQQQGRVQTDADWNEQEALGRRRTQVEARDVIGLCGAPRDNAGFEIALNGSALTIGPGRYYVDGILCEQDAAGAVPYEKQAQYPEPPKWQDALEASKASYAIVYLDAWERHVTPLDDARLREVALGGPDTAHRVQTVWQVKVLPLTTQLTLEERKKLKARRDQRVKLLDQAVAGGKLEEAARIQAALGKIDAQLALPACDAKFSEWDSLTGDSARTLNARTVTPAAGSGPCVVAPTAGYRGLENQLYRVEVHDPGAPGAGATFKWSRDNGSVVTSIEKISGKEVTVHDLGPDDVLGFRSGQWCELGDDVQELAGKPGQLLQIDSIDSATRKITFKTAPAPLAGNADGVDKRLHPKLRRWDQQGAVSVGNGWLPLENGIEVQFSNGAFKNGDYWLIPARTATGEIEWPPYAVPNTAPQAQPPLGIRHHYCRLALLKFDVPKKSWVVSDDCRSKFAPLTQPCCGQKALHVAATNWNNDDVFSFVTANSEGLRVTLDAPADPASLTNDTFQVAIEMPLVQNGKASPIQYQLIYIRGVVSTDPADPRVVVWKPVQEKNMRTAARGGKARSSRAGVKPMAAMFASMLAAPTEIKPAQFMFKVRITLKGHDIWNAQARSGEKLIHLDGCAHGQPGMRSGSQSPRIALQFPSGSGGLASNFESWLHLVEQAPAKEPLQIKTVRFLDADGAIVKEASAFTPVPAAGTVSFKAGEHVSQVEVEFNKAVNAASLDSNKAPGLFFLDADAGSQLKVLLKLTSENVVSCTLQDPEIFLEGQCTLNCLGALPAGAALTLLTDSDGAALDGDYDGSPGGNFVLAFQAL